MMVPNELKNYAHSHACTLAINMCNNCNNVCGHERINGIGIKMVIWLFLFQIRISAVNNWIIEGKREPAISIFIQRLINKREISKQLSFSLGVIIIQSIIIKWIFFFHFLFVPLSTAFEQFVWHLIELQEFNFSITRWFSDTFFTTRIIIVRWWRMFCRGENDTHTQERVREERMCEKAKSCSVYLAIR